MDSPSIDEADHLHALSGLARLNALSGGGRSLWPSLRTIPAASPISAIDVATGSGDITLWLAKRAHKAGLDIRWTLCDISERAVETAQKRMRGAGFECEGVVRDVLRNPLPGRFDVVTCSLFLHHLDPPDVRRLLANMGASTRGVLLVNDLRRTKRNLLLSRVIPKLVTSSRVVWFDAVASVRASYTKPELEQIATDAGLHGVRVNHAWPQRMVLRWQPKPSSSAPA